MTREHRDYADTLTMAIHEKNETRWHYTGDDFEAALMAADRLMAYVTSTPRAPK